MNTQPLTAAKISETDGRFLDVTFTPENLFRPHDTYQAFLKSIAKLTFDPCLMFGAILKQGSNRPKELFRAFQGGPNSFWVTP